MPRRIVTVCRMMIVCVCACGGGGGGPAEICRLTGNMTRLCSFIFVFPFNFGVLQRLRGRARSEIIIPNVYVMYTCAASLLLLALG